MALRIRVQWMSARMLLEAFTMALGGDPGGWLLGVDTGHQMTANFHPIHLEDGQLLDTPGPLHGRKRVYAVHSCIP
jgi:hypothetical protein